MGKAVELLLKTIPSHRAFHRPSASSHSTTLPRSPFSSGRTWQAATNFKATNVESCQRACAAVCPHTHTHTRPACRPLTCTRAPAASPDLGKPCLDNTLSYAEGCTYNQAPLQLAEDVSLAGERGPTNTAKYQWWRGSIESLASTYSRPQSGLLRAQVMAIQTLGVPGFTASVSQSSRLLVCRRKGSAVRALRSHDIIRSERS